MNRTDLVRIAADMKRDIGYGAVFTQRVVERTHLRLLRRDCGFELLVGRADVCPDPDDCAVIAHAFDAPTDDPTHVQFRVLAQDGSSIPIKALRYTWIELPC